MKQKDEIDILYVALFVNACLTDFWLFWLQHFYRRIEKF